MWDNFHDGQRIGFQFLIKMYGVLCCTIGAGKSFRMQKLLIQWGRSRYRHVLLENAVIFTGDGSFVWISRTAGQDRNAHGEGKNAAQSLFYLFHKWTHPFVFGTSLSRMYLLLIPTNNAAIHSIDLEQDNTLIRVCSMNGVK